VLHFLLDFTCWKCSLYFLTCILHTLSSRLKLLKFVCIKCMTFLYIYSVNLHSQSQDILLANHRTYNNIAIGVDNIMIIMKTLYTLVGTS